MPVLGPSFLRKALGRPSTSPSHDALMAKLNEVAARLEAKEITPDEADAEASALISAQSEAISSRIDADLRNSRNDVLRKLAVVVAIVAAGLAAKYLFGYGV